MPPAIDKSDVNRDFGSKMRASFIVGYHSTQTFFIKKCIN